MDKRTNAIFDVRLGIMTMNDAAAKCGVSGSTFKRWMDSYEIPDKQIMMDLLAEKIIEMLRGKTTGTDINAIINAMNKINEGQMGISIDALVEMGNDDETYNI